MSTPSLPVLFDSLTKQLEVVPVSFNQPISFYACGITPYSPSHIGHARSFVVFDVMKSMFEAHGHPTRLIRNITDIDDKIIAAAQEQGVSWQDISWTNAKRNRQEFLELGVVTQEEPKASEHIDGMIDLVQKLLEQDYAYISPKGDVLFDTHQFEPSRLRVVDPEHQHHVSRVDQHGKRHAENFVLWKTVKSGEPSWPSPWGHGRPGWHLECSAMVESLVGDTLSYHGGGIDLCFPHHQAEIFQSEAAFNRPLAHRWVHHGAVRDHLGRKMSKSLGNTVILQDALKQAEDIAPGAGGALVRFALIGTLWTQPLYWKDDLLKTTHERLLKWVRAQSHGNKTFTSSLPNPAVGILGHNLNTPQIFAQLDQWSKSAKEDQQHAFWVKDTLHLLGVTEAWMEALLTEPVLQVPQDVQALVDLRHEARKAKNFAQSDQLRLQIEMLGWIVEDQAQQSHLKKKPL